MGNGMRKNYQRYRVIFLNLYKVYQKRADARMFLEIILSLVTISFFTLFALRPTALTITQLLQEIKAKEEVLAKLDQKIVDIGTAQSLYAQENSRLGLIDNAIPKIASPESFARQIEGLGKIAGVNLTNIVIDDIVLFGENAPLVATTEDTPLAAPGSKVVGFSLNALGEYPELAGFIASLESLRRIVQIDNMTIGNVQTQEGTSLTLSVTGRVAYYP